MCFNSDDATDDVPASPTPFPHEDDASDDGLYVYGDALCDGLRFLRDERRPRREKAPPPSILHVLSVLLISDRVSDVSAFIGE